MDSLLLGVKEVQYCQHIEHRESTLSSGRSGGLHLFLNSQWLDAVLKRGTGWLQFL